MATIKQPLLARHMTTVTLTGQTATSAGVLSDNGSAVTVTTFVDSLTESITPTNEEINGVNSTLDNMVRVSDGYRMSLAVIKVNDGTDVSKLKTLVRNNDIIKAVWTEGTVTGQIATTTAYFTRGAFQSGIQGRGKQLGTLELEPVDAGGSTFTVALT